MGPKLTTTENLGARNIRQLLHSFEIRGPHGTHAVLVFQPAQMSLRDMKAVFQKDGFDETLVKGTVQELLKALDFLHTEAQVVHTGMDRMLNIRNHDVLTSSRCPSRQFASRPG